MRNYEFKLTPAYCLYNGVAVVNQEGSHICFMAENPEDGVLKNRLKKAFDNFVNYVLLQNDCPSQFRLEPAVMFVSGSRAEIRKYVSRLYSMPEQKLVEKALPLQSVTKNTENDAAAVLLLDTILSEARAKNATDIHIEKNTVRFRISGKLENNSYIQGERGTELIQRIKFLAGMNVLEKRRSQDGHFIFGKEDPVFVRVSVMGIIGQEEAVTEESVVMRLLDTRRLPLKLNSLGFTRSQSEEIQKIITEKDGLVIICGPTGAGKSTTAAAMLLDIKNRRENTVKIISLEDPPEYVIPGVSQIQIDEKIDNSFSEALRHVFRQDPDVLMIGEIRDETSAAVALRAALTGHLVIATLHTSTAAGAILRLENLAVPRPLILSVLKGVIVQDLKAVGKTISLAADVSVPTAYINSAMNKELTQAELEKCFNHNTNYMQVLEQTLGIMKNKHNADPNCEKAALNLNERKDSPLVARGETGLKKLKRRTFVRNKKNEEMEDSEIG